MKKQLFAALFLAAVGVSLYSNAADPPTSTTSDSKTSSNDVEGEVSGSPLTGVDDLSSSGEAEFDEPSRSPAEMYDEMDPAFAKFVDLSLLADAMAGPDAALLADVSLGLAEGERVLVRNHRSGLNSESLMVRTVKLAARINDKATLDRIAKAATVANKPQWEKLVAETKEFADVSRDGPMVAIGKVDMSGVDLTQAVQYLCDIAVVTNQKDELEELKKTVASSQVDKKIKDYLTGLIDNTSKSITATSSGGDELLLEFASSSRDGGATAAAYVLQEAVSFGRQVATGWSVSYQYVNPQTGAFKITFKNRIVNGVPPFQLVTPCWVDVEGNFSTGRVSVNGRGSDVARILARTMESTFRNAATRFRTLWQQPGPGPVPPHSSYFDVNVRNNAGVPLSVYVHYRTPSNTWRTDRFTFSTGRTARLNIQTRNRVIYFRATSSDGRTWGNSSDSAVFDGKRFDKSNMGEHIGRFTYTFNR